MPSEPSASATPSELPLSSTDIYNSSIGDCIFGAITDTRLTTGHATALASNSVTAYQRADILCGLQYVAGGDSGTLGSFLIKKMPSMFTYGSGNGYLFDFNDTNSTIYDSINQTPFTILTKN